MLGASAILVGFLIIAVDKIIDHATGLTRLLARMVFDIGTRDHAAALELAT